MSTLDSYLDTLFAPYPTSPKMRAARAELLTMMEDKQADLIASGHTEAQAVGQVIAEFGSLDEVAEALGITHEVTAEASAAPGLSLERAQAYLRTHRAKQPLLALAIALFVLSPIPPVLTTALVPESRLDAQPLPLFLSLIVLLALVAAGIGILVIRHSALAAYRDVTDDPFTPEAHVRTFARDTAASHRSRETVGLVAALALWILSPAPLFVLTGLYPDSERSTLGVVGTLVLVAVGLAVYFLTHDTKEPTDVLLGIAQKERDADPTKSDNAAIRVIAAIYWPAVIVTYLLWSFIDDAWGSTWIIWPIAGILWGAFWAVHGALGAKSDH